MIWKLIVYFVFILLSSVLVLFLSELCSEFKSTLTVLYVFLYLFIYIDICVSFDYISSIKASSAKGAMNSTALLTCSQAVDLATLEAFA